MPDAPGPHAQSLRRNALANVAGRGAAAVLWVLVTPFVLARLGQERFGVWSLFFAFGTYVATLDLGMANTVTRYVAVATARNDRRSVVLVLRRSLLISAGLGLLWCVCLIALRGPLMRAFHVPPALEPEVGGSLGVFAFALLAFSVTQVLNGALMGFQRLDLSNFGTLAGLLLHAAILVASLAAGLGLAGAAAAMVSGHLLAAALFAGWARKLLRRMPRGEGVEPVTWRELLHFSGAIQVTSACAIGQLQAGKVMLGLLGRLSWVTQFDLGFRVASAVWSLPTLVQGAVIPASAHASAAGEAGRAVVRGVYEWACRWIFALAGVVLSALWLLAPPLITLWLGPGHAEPIAVTRALAVTFAVAVLSGPATAVARGGGWPLLESWNFVVAIALNVLIGMWAIPRFGLMGAAAAMAISYGVAGAWLVVVIHRLLAVRDGAWLLRVAAPRFLGPAAAALLLHALWPATVLEGRAEALRLLLIQGAAFTLLATALSWPTGDARALWSRLRARRVANPGTPAPARGAR